MMFTNLRLTQSWKPISRRNIKMEDIFSQIKKGELIGKVVSSGNHKARVDITQSDALLQIAAINFSKFQEVKKHKHLPLHRETFGTSEVWLVTNGKFLITFFDTDDSKLSEFTIRKGELVVLFAGGHSLISLSKNARILEFKNGPYKGVDLDKVHI